MAPPIVLIHGICCTPSVWDHFRQELERHGRTCLVPTLPLHTPGAPSNELAKLSMKDYVRSLEHDIKARGWTEPPVLIGHSLGGLLAQMLATRMEVEAVVLVASESPAGLLTTDRNKLMSFREVLTTPRWWSRALPLSYETCRTHLLNNMSELRARQIYSTLVAESGKVFFETGMWPLDRDRTTAVDAAAVTCPVLVVGAALDAILSVDHARGLAKHYAGSAYREYPFNAHWIIDEDGVDTLVDDIVAWLDSEERHGHRVRTDALVAVPAGHSPPGLLGALSSALVKLVSKEVDKRLGQASPAERALLEHGLEDDDVRTVWGLMGRVPLFEHLTGEQLAVLAGLLEPETHPEGTEVIGPDDEGASMYFVVDGTLEIHAPEEVVPIGPGDFFGEISLLLGGERTATVRTTSEVLLLALARSDYEAMARLCPEVDGGVREAGRQRLARRVRAAERGGVEGM